MIAARQIAFGGSKRKPYDAEIAYLESTGTQYIDTGVVPLIGDSIEMRFAVTRALVTKEWEQLMGAGSGTYQLCFPTGIDGNGKIVYVRVFGGGVNWVGASFIRVPDLEIGIHKLDVRYSGGNLYKVSTDDSYMMQEAMGEIDGVNRTLLIFQRPTVGGAYIRCYDFVLYNEDKTILDLIPVRVGDVGYMYDKVSGKLFGNAGTGAFVLGADI